MISALQDLLMIRKSFLHSSFLFAGIHSQGPQAHLLRGVVEQNVIFHVMDYALCLSESKKAICRTEGLISGRNSSVSLNGGTKWTLIMLSILWSFVVVIS